MMQKRFHIFRDVAITNQPTGDNITARDYIVTWGQRGRIGEQSIKPRVLFAASRVLPEFDSVTALNSVPAPIAMIEGNDWIDNLSISPVPLNRQKSLENEPQAEYQRPITYRYYQKAIPKH